MLDVCAFFGLSDALLLGCVCEVEEGLVSVDGWVVGCSLVGEGYGWERGEDGWWLLDGQLKGEIKWKEGHFDAAFGLFVCGGSPRVVCPAVFYGFCELSEGAS